MSLILDFALLWFYKFLFLFLAENSHQCSIYAFVYYISLRRKIIIVRLYILIFIFLIQENKTLEVLRSLEELNEQLLSCRAEAIAKDDLLAKQAAGHTLSIFLCFAATNLIDLLNDCMEIILTYDLI